MANKEVTSTFHLMMNCFPDSFDEKQRLVVAGMVASRLLANIEMPLRDTYAQVFVNALAQSLNAIDEWERQGNGYAN
jgi:hypothetical protein